MQANRERNRWIRCPNCGHKLFKLIGSKPLSISISSEMYIDGLPKLSDNLIEIKCHSCKEIVRIEDLTNLEI